MKKSLKVLIAVFVVLLVVTGCSKDTKKTNKVKVVSTIYPGYDFSKAVGKDNIDLTMLLKPGSETHSYDPTPKDIIKIQESDIFIYVGGESDEWVEDILKSIDSKKTKVIRMMDLVELKEEEIVEGMQPEQDDEEEDDDETEFDEHVWTSPINAIAIVKKIENQLIKIDSKHEQEYKENSKKYVEELNQLNKEFIEIVENGKRKELVFGDRFPLRYFADEYGLEYKAAFPGCSSDTEINAKTIAYLVDKIKKDNIPVVFYLELSNQKIADTLIEDTKAKKLEFHAVHNVTKKEFDQGVTYIEFMKRNAKNLREALN